MIFQIYTLSDPITNEIRYVGQTIQKITDRLRKHIKSKDKSHRTNWITNLKNRGLVPIINVIKICGNKEDSDFAERYFIKFYRESLNYNLVNETDGGGGSIGFKHKPESILKMQLKVITDDFREKCRINGKNSWYNKTEKEKSDNILLQPKRQSIEQLDLDGNLIKEFISLRAIERDLGFFRANILLHIKGKQSHAYGYLWRKK